MSKGIQANPATWASFPARGTDRRFHADRGTRWCARADRLRASRRGPGWRAARRWQRRPPPTPTRPPTSALSDLLRQSHRVPGHRHPPAGTTPVAASASPPSAAAQSGGAHTRTSAPGARNRTASPTTGSAPRATHTPTTTPALRNSHVRRFWPGSAILRHDLRLAASPPARHMLRMVRWVSPLPDRLLRTDNLLAKRRRVRR